MLLGRNLKISGISGLATTVGAKRFNNLLNFGMSNNNNNNQSCRMLATSRNNIRSNRWKRNATVSGQTIPSSTEQEVAAMERSEKLRIEMIEASKYPKYDKATRKILKKYPLPPNPSARIELRKNYKGDHPVKIGVVSAPTQEELDAKLAQRKNVIMAKPEQGIRLKGQKKRDEELAAKEKKKAEEEAEKNKGTDPADNGDGEKKKKKKPTVLELEAEGSKEARNRKNLHPIKLFDHDVLRNTTKNVGRAWLASELRLKSMQDLHKLWFVLLDERNKLLSLRFMSRRERVPMQGPGRLKSVRQSMARLKTVIREREIEAGLMGLPKTIVYKELMDSLGIEQVPIDKTIYSKEKKKAAASAV